MQYEVFYEHQHLGRVERVVSGYRNEHWAYQSADGTITGKRGPMTEAVWQLFDRVVRQPIERVEPWEQFLEGQKQEKMRKAMKDYAKSITIDALDKKPN